MTPKELRQGIEWLQRRINDLEAFDPQSVDDGSDPKLLAIQTAISRTLSDVFGQESADRELYKAAAYLDPQAQGRNYRSLGSRLNGDGSYQLGTPGYKRDVVASVTEGKDRALHLLNEAIAGLQERLEYIGVNLSSQPVEFTNKVFVVHGREEGPREAVARFLSKIGFEPVILHEQANKGQTVIEKIEAHSDVGFTVVLLTPDDEGNLKGDAPQPRARQNVLLELGYFIAKLGRERVCTLKVREVEIPSDWRGIIDEPFDGNWQMTLARELQAVGYEIDWNKVMRS